MGGAQVLALVTLLGTPLGAPLAVGAPMDALGSPMDVGRPLDVGGALALVGRPPCRPLNMTVALEKDACPQCLAVTVTACGGFCRTREPVYRSPLGSPPQGSCGYRGVRWERRLLPGCPPGSDPAVWVPEARGCGCSRCPLAAADCAGLGQALGPAFCGAPAGFGPQ
ncbi:LOW QUALITY PROTEIN: lutropin subunit beta-like [Phaenicophaeus curvirostris]|uniref:LOW QUALITY PROTEIN: lutropin subunit beta-like n=1 Tax=Phaenicophaeus curvirostris TaxID=33595 RepID=UPI0037F0A759